MPTPESAQSDHVFGGYASAYDALYSDKNYEAEVDFVEEALRRFAKEQPAKRILDMGCGTGGHSIPLAKRGKVVVGIDRSAAMLDLARHKATEQGVAQQIRFEKADIQSFELNQSFDAAICMFAVLGYQTSNAQLFSTLECTRRHLAPGSLFLCDFWYGPAVLNVQPSDRVKVMSIGEERILRTAQPKLDLEKNVVSVHYHLLRLRASQVLAEMDEVHQMRYFFKPELEFFLGQAGFKLIHFCEFGDFARPAAESTWNVCAVAGAV
jgi:SAM-dependent methyltransferase